LENKILLPRAMPFHGEEEIVKTSKKWKKD
jgi:hypothetical protein